MIEKRLHEHEKYVRAYQIKNYAMGDGRKRDAIKNLSALPVRGSYLDVGCGRGEMVDYAASIGFNPVWGVDVVPALIHNCVIYGEAHDLPFPDKSFDVATLFDVIEHLVPGDDEAACKELLRVARRHILLTANSGNSFLPDGTQLHINQRPRQEWDRLFAEWFAPGKAYRLQGPIHYPNSPSWRVDL